jgi:RNA polymerase sigma-70 factor (ECF subfamily)
MIGEETQLYHPLPQLKARMSVAREPKPNFVRQSPYVPPKTDAKIWNFPVPCAECNLTALEMAQPNLVTALSDEDLLRQIKTGDEEAFLTLYRRRHEGIFRFAQQMSGSSTVAEEVTQEVFLLLVRKPDTFNPSLGSLLSFLYGVARNQVRRHRDLGRTHTPLIEEGTKEPASAEADPLSDLTRVEMVEAVRQAVLSLPENYRAVVTLCDLQEESYQHTAEVLNVPVGTVRSRLSRARALLMDKLQHVKTRCLA